MVNNILEGKSYGEAFRQALKKSYQVSLFHAYQDRHIINIILCWVMPLDVLFSYSLLQSLLFLQTPVSYI